MKCRTTRKRWIGLVPAVVVLMAGLSAHKILTDKSGVVVKDPPDNRQLVHTEQSNPLESGEPGEDPPPRAELPVSNAESPASDPIQQSGMTGPRLREWPESPEVMEALVGNELVQITNLQVISMSHIECTTVECEIHFLSTEGPLLSNLAGGDQFTETFTNPPFDAIVGEAIFPTESGAYEHKLTLTTELTLPSSDEHDAFPLSADTLERIADRHLSSDEFDAPRAVHPWYGVNIMIENVCSYDCPLDTERVIHIEVPDGYSCDQAFGVEQPIVTRMDTGELQERTYCVPNTLVMP